MVVEEVVFVVDRLLWETVAFAAIWFLVGGIDDLLVDILFVARSVHRGIGGLGKGRSGLGVVPRVGPPHRLAIFVAAWDESAVIGAMLKTALARFDYPDFRIYVGAYPNDGATIDAVAAAARGDPRVRLVVGPREGPTTKADCLNAIWRAMLRHERAGERRFDAVILHDAEDMVHPQELAVFDAHLDRYAAVQLPVLPLRHPRSPLVSGHYCDEFVVAHAQHLLVRGYVGAGLPLAGVGCALRRDVVDRIAAGRGGEPFDASSLTEDYELGLAIAAMGERATLARVAETPGGELVAVRAYFPSTVAAAVRQKARWMTGIALAGWDRTGWSRGGRIGDHWMRMRDRRATLAIPVLLVAYVALLLWGASIGLHAVLGDGTSAEPLSVALQLILALNLILLAWRMAVRMLLVGRAYGLVDALLSVPRMVVANYISLLAARRALFLYLDILRGQAARWDKTAHEFPDDAAPPSPPGAAK